MNNNTTSTTSGISVSGLLGVAFVVLKLTHLIDWSWWWVTLPFWGGLALVLVIFIIGFVVIVINETLKDRRKALARKRYTEIK